ncbi:hypothetical protein [Carnobacterium divergens]|uniref:hypothetical protein n=1 Tax=Carnobacterium divergens TaxID=2748 RepID=UPI0039B00EA2
MFNPNEFYTNEQWHDIVRRCTKLPTDRVYMVMPRNQGKTMFLNMMKKLEELEKMIKIDETKQYKFSEIVRMVEDKVLPVGTKVAPHNVFEYLVVGKGTNGNNLIDRYGYACITFNMNLAFREFWTIKLPKEEQFYLKAPDSFEMYSVYLNYDKELKKYSLDDKFEIQEFQSKFTQSEISAMPFKTSFFKQIKVNEE